MVSAPHWQVSGALPRAPGGARRTRSVSQRGAWGGRPPRQRSHSAKRRHSSCSSNQRASRTFPDKTPGGKTHCPSKPSCMLPLRFLHMCFPRCGPREKLRRIPQAAGEPPRGTSPGVGSGWGAHLAPDARGTAGGLEAVATSGGAVHPVPRAGRRKCPVGSVPQGEAWGGGLQKEPPVYGRRASYSSRRQARRKRRSPVTATQSMSLACRHPGRLGPGSHSSGSQNPGGGGGDAFPKLLSLPTYSALPHTQLEAPHT